MRQRGESRFGALRHGAKPLTAYRKTLFFTVARRMAFTLGLLSVGASTAALCQNLISAYRVPGSAQLPAIAIFVWGANRLDFVLAAWLVFRVGLWTSWAGWLRVAMYLVAFAYGNMLFHPAQDRWTSHGSAFEWPGFEVADYRRSGIHRLLELVWLMLPLVWISSRALTDAPCAPATKKPLSIFTILGWISLAAIVLAAFRLVSSSSRSFATHNYFLFLAQEVPLSLVYIAAGMAVLWGWSQKWYVALLSLPLALGINAVGTRMCIAVAESLLVGTPGDIRRSPLYWAYVSGSVFVVWLAFGIARLSGMTFATCGAKNERLDFDTDKDQELASAGN